MDKYEMIDQFLVERAVEVLEASDENIDDKELDEKVSKITDNLADLKKEYRALSHAIERKDIKEAKDLYKKAEKMIDDIEDMIDDLPEIKDKSDKSKAVVKRIANAVFGLSAAITLVGVGASAVTTDNKVLGVTLGGIGGMIGSAVALSLNKTFKDKMRSVLNKYQMSMFAAINRINDIEDEKKEDEIRANTKNININRTSTNTNDTTIRYESASVTSTKLAIYEACDNGFITETEKSELLNIIESSFSDKVNEANKGFKDSINDSLTKNKEKMNKAIDSTVDDEMKRSDEELMKMFPELAKTLKK